jgi:hypothetical protein
MTHARRKGWCHITPHNFERTSTGDGASCACTSQHIPCNTYCTTAPLQHTVPVCISCCLLATSWHVRRVEPCPAARQQMHNVHVHSSTQPPPSPVTELSATQAPEGEVMQRSLGRHNSDPQPTDDQKPITATKIGCELPRPLDDGVSTLQCQRASMPNYQTHAKASSKRNPQKAQSRLQAGTYACSMCPCMHIPGLAQSGCQECCMTGKFAGFPNSEGTF